MHLRRKCIGLSSSLHRGSDNLRNLHVFSLPLYDLLELPDWHKPVDLLALVIVWYVATSQTSLSHQILNRDPDGC